MINKIMAEKIADDMFDLSFDGYSTHDLAEHAGITDGEAIFLQSGSTVVEQDVYNKMAYAIRKLKNEQLEVPKFAYIMNADNNSKTSAKNGSKPSVHLDSLSYRKNYFALPIKNQSTSSKSRAISNRMPGLSLQKFINVLSNEGNSEYNYRSTEIVFK